MQKTKSGGKDCVISICVTQPYYNAVCKTAKETDTSVSAMMRNMIYDNFKEEINRQKKSIEDSSPISPMRQGNLLDYCKASTKTTV